MSRPAEKADLAPEPSGGVVQPSPRSTSSTWMGKLSTWASAGMRMQLPALHAGSTSCWQSSLMVCPPSMKCSKNLLFRYRLPEGSSRRKITRWSKVLWSLKKASGSATEVCFSTRSFRSMSVVEILNCEPSEALGHLVLFALGRHSLELLRFLAVI